MNDQLQKQLSQFLQLMLDGIEKGAAFAGQQFPLIIQEKLHYDLLNCLLWAGFWAFIIAAIWILILVGVRKCGATSDERIVGYLWAAGLSIVVSFPLFYCLSWALYIYMAPRLYILEWLKTLIK